MSTTNLFVELLVIGVGVDIWLALLGCAIFGFAWLGSWPTDVVSLLPVLATTYVFGILMDRMSDALLSKRVERLRVDCFGSEAAYRDARLAVASSSPRAVVELFEYGRSRVRIVRSWAFTFVLLAITATPAFILHVQAGRPWMRIAVGLVSGASLLGLGLAAYWSWLQMMRNDCLRLREANGLSGSHDLADPKRGVPVSPGPKR